MYREENNREYIVNMGEKDEKRARGSKEQNKKKEKYICVRTQVQMYTR